MIRTRIPFFWLVVFSGILIVAAILDLLVLRWFVRKVPVKKEEFTFPAYDGDTRKFYYFIQREGSKHEKCIGKAWTTAEACHYLFLCDIIGCQVFLWFPWTAKGRRKNGVKITDNIIIELLVQAINNLDIGIDVLEKPIETWEIGLQRQIALVSGIDPNHTRYVRMCHWLEAQVHCLNEKTVSFSVQEEDFERKE